MMAASRNKYDRLYVYMEHIKLIKAQQAKSVHWYNDTREELLQSIVAIWFKKSCTDVNLSVCYINTISCRIDYFTINLSLLVLVIAGTLYIMIHRIFRKYSTQS